MRHLSVRLWGLAAVLVVGAGTAASAQNAPAVKQLYQSDLQGVPGQEALMFTVDFAPGQSLPWHVHPGGHELLYVVEGTLTIEDQNNKKVFVQPGGVNMIFPDVGHTARNDGTTNVRAVVIRIKDKSKPVAAPFQH